MANLRTISGHFLATNWSIIEAERQGFRFGARGTHTSRTMMFDELSTVLTVTPSEGRREDYALAIIESNCLGKPTVATRRLTNQRLGELYALDPTVPLFRVLRQLWDLDPNSGRLLALQCALARDPLLEATAPAIIALSIGSEFLREPMKTTLRLAVGDRLNDSILDKVIRNAASSWTQSGHLAGRTFKKRRAVAPTAMNAAYAVYLAHASGFRGADIFASAWLTVIDCSPSSGRELVLEAKRLGLLDLRIAGDVVELALDRLDPATARF